MRAPRHGALGGCEGEALRAEGHDFGVVDLSHTATCSVLVKSAQARLGLPWSDGIARIERRSGRPPGLHPNSRLLHSRESGSQGDRKFERVKKAITTKAIRCMKR